MSITRVILRKNISMGGRKGGGGGGGGWNDFKEGNS